MGSEVQGPARRLPELRWPFRIAGGVVAILGLFALVNSLIDGVASGDWTSPLFDSPWIAIVSVAVIVTFGAAAILGRVPAPLWRFFAWSSARE